MTKTQEVANFDRILSSTEDGYLSDTLHYIRASFVRAVETDMPLLRNLMTERKDLEAELADTRKTLETMRKSKTELETETARLTYIRDRAASELEDIRRAARTLSYVK